MKKLLICLLALASASYATAQPKDAAHPEWEKEIPRVIHPDEALVDLYEKTWAIAADRVRIGPPGLPASPYLDENCYDSQIWIWDACFMVLFSKYAPEAYPGKQTLNNISMCRFSKTRQRPCAFTCATIRPCLPGPNMATTNLPATVST